MMKMTLIRRINYTLKHFMPKIVYPFFLKYKYYLRFRRICDLSEPKTYTEKMQWAKLHRDNKALAYFADKIAVREYIRNTVGEEYLVPLVGGIYKSPNQIDLNSLPRKFVIKANHGCGFNYIVTDKSLIDENEMRKTLNSWLNIDISYFALELQYRYIEPRLYVEKYLITDKMTDLPDYKFFCFNGKVYCLYVMVDTIKDHHKSKLGIFDKDFNLLPYYREDFTRLTKQVPKPENYDEMVRIAEKLSEGFSHVRIDLYDINGKIYFGEMTFTTAAGLFKHVPEEFDLMLGEQWDLTKGI